MGGKRSPFLEHNNFICLQIAQVDVFSLGFHVWVLLDQQPSHMREEKSSTKAKNTRYYSLIFGTNDMEKYLAYEWGSASVSVCLWWSLQNSFIILICLFSLNSIIHSPMIAYPFMDTILEYHTIEDHQNQPHLPCCLIWTMWPKTMCSASHTNRAHICISHHYFQRTKKETTDINQIIQFKNMFSITDWR